MILRSDKVQDNKIKTFLKQTIQVSSKTFGRKWEGETLLKLFFNFKQPEQYQNEHHPYNLNLISFWRRTFS